MNKTFLFVVVSLCLGSNIICMEGDQQKPVAVSMNATDQVQTDANNNGTCKSCKALVECDIANMGCCCQKIACCLGLYCYLKSCDDDEDTCL